MNLYRIINDIKSTCMSHRDVQDFHYGDIYDYENTKSLKYINTNFTLQNIASGLDSDTKTINGVLFCVDRLTDNGDNKLIVQSRCTDILQNIINRLTENYSGWSLENTVYEVFSTKFADLCAGCFCTFSLSVDEDSVCSDDEFVVKSKEIKGNGIYDVIGYDRIIVDVQPKLKEIEIVKNGVYLPEEDSDGYNKITVNVPPTPVQEKSVNITENGVKRIEPDSGYNLSGVDVNVNVPPKKSVINGGNITFRDTTEIDDNIEIVGLTTCEYMFAYNYLLSSLPIMDTSKVTNMSSMFTYCSTITSIPVLNTSKVTNMYQMFYNCKSLTSVPEMDTSKVTNMDTMFYNCSALTSVPEMDMSNLPAMSTTFFGCSNLTSVGGFVNLGKAFTSAQTIYFNYPNLDNQSVQNIIDTIFDMNLNTQGGSATIKLRQTVIDAMTDEQKSQLAAKGWTLTN